MNDDNDELLLSRIEDAGLNASAPPQQRWLDGWIVRTSPGKARRARCINAVAPGRMPLERKLALASAVFAAAALPLVLRITRFTLPATLDEQLAALGWERLDDTCVMVRRGLAPHDAQPMPAGVALVKLAAAPYAAMIGEMRGSPADQRSAHAQRLSLSPVPYSGYAICREDSTAVVACGQFVREGDIVGLYDVFTAESERRKGWATLLCERLLALAAAEGATTAYLQTEASNEAARSVYRRLGFADAYGYHYRQPPGAATAALLPEISYGDTGLGGHMPA